MAIGSRSAHRMRCALTAYSSETAFVPESNISDQQDVSMRPVTIIRTVTITATTDDGLRAETQNGSVSSAMRTQGFHPSQVRGDSSACIATGWTVG